MPQIANRLTTFEPSTIVEIANRVNDMKKNGEDVVNFSIGIPNFTPPAHVYEAARQSLKDDMSVKYLPSRGIPELLDAWTARLGKDGFDYTTDEVCVSLGGKNALFNLFLAFLEDGGEAIFPAPFWSSYTGMIKFVGGNSKIIRCGADQDYKLRPEQLEEAITDKTRVFLFNNPNNPTGMVYTEEEVAALGDVLVKHPDIWILSDDIYDKLIYDGEKFHHLLHTHPELKDRTFIMQSVSKAYGMPGWRVGMTAGPKEIITKLTKVAGQSFMNVPGVAQVAASAAFGGSHEFLKEVKSSFVHKRDLVMDALEEIPGIVCPFPHGAFYAFPDVSAYFGGVYNGTTIDNSETLCKLLLEETKVGTVPGSAFGEPNALRISYACSEKQLKVGMERIAKFFSQIEGGLQKTA